MTTDTASPDTGTAELRNALSRFDKPAIRSHVRSIKRPDLSHIPGDRGLPIIGHALQITYQLHTWINAQYECHGPAFRARAVDREIVFFLGPEANRIILQNEGKDFSNFLAYGPSIKGLLDDNVLALDFHHHKHTRKTLQAAFRREAVEGHIELMNPMISGGIDHWVTDRTVKSTPQIRKLLLDTGAKVFLGLDMGRDADMMNQAFVDLVKAGNAIVRLRSIPFLPYARALRARVTMEDFVRSNIAGRRSVPEEGRDIFSQLCNAKDEHGNHLSDKEVCNQIIFLLFAAHDTTSSAMSSTFYHLASDQAWQEELREEMFSLGKEHLEFDDFDKLEKTHWTVQEILRMYPPAPMLPRYSLKEFEFEGLRIPLGTPLMGFSPFTHYMSEYWTDPYTFDPLRFSPERAEDKKEFWQYVPFGGGAHKCLGLHFAQVQGKMFLFHFLKKYRIYKDPKMDHLRFRFFPLTFPTDGLPLKFVRTDSSGA